jgi:hypothetical protein
MQTETQRVARLSLPPPLLLLLLLVVVDRVMVMVRTRLRFKRC